MKKLLLAGLLITFAGIGIAKEKPATIVNPPRPTSQFKWLLVYESYDKEFSQHNTHYFYADRFKFKFSKVGVHIMFDFNSPYMECVPSGTPGVLDCGYHIGGVYGFGFYSTRRDVFSTHTLHILKAKVPSFYPKQYGPAEIVWAKNQMSNRKVRLQKAKVVFTR